MAHVERNPDGIMAWLRAEAATGRALRAADLACARWTTTQISASLFYLMSAGHLYRAKLAFKQVFYLASQQAADDYVAQHQAAYVAAKLQAALAREAAKPPKLRHGKARFLPAAAVAVPAATQAAQARLAEPVQPPSPRPLPAIIYCPSPTTGPLSGRCPPDRTPVLRAGALDYRRHMAKHQQGSAA